jgi:hypothetical protein
MDAAMTSWQTLWVEPPPPGAPRADQRRFVRDLQLRVLAMCVVVLVVVLLVGAPTWVLAVALAGLVLGGLDALYLTIALRRAR